jgi:hypothetical protein
MPEADIHVNGLTRRQRNDSLKCCLYFSIITRLLNEAACAAEKNNKKTDNWCIFSVPA